MNKIKALLLKSALLASVALTCTPTVHASVFINEFHYDNVGADVGESIEIAALAGTDVSGWSVLLYNGAIGMVYSSTLLSVASVSSSNGFDFLTISYPTNGIQNGAPDGIALVDSSNAVVQFLSYEGTFIALDGAASGMVSTDIGIGVFEDGSSPIGGSLQLTGFGTSYNDFTWGAFNSSTFGGANTRQTFQSSAPIPEPATLALLGLGLAGLAASRHKPRRPTN